MSDQNPRRRRPSTGRKLIKTRWQGVYERDGLYYGKLYVGKIDGASRYEWLEGQRTGKAAADLLAAARADRPSKRGRRHTVASWAQRTSEHPCGLWLALRPRAKRATNETYAEQVAPFVAAYGDMALEELDVELALEWITVRQMRWTLGGVRAMVTDARRAGLVTSNPFVGMGLTSGRGRRDLEVLTEAEVLELAETAARTWPRSSYGQVWRALVLWQAFVGTRPAEAYALTRADLDGGQVHVRRQRPPADARTAPEDLPLPKNGRARTVNVHPLALEAVRALPTPLRPDAPLFQAARGGPMHGGTQHYYWHPIRCAFGRPSMDLYELRHFCGSYHLNDLQLAPQDVAEQLGHTDGGVLVQRLYGHPSAELARRRIADAYQRPAPAELRAVEGQ